MPTPRLAAFFSCLLLALSPSAGRSQSTLTLDDFTLDDTANPEDHSAIDLCDRAFSSAHSVEDSENGDSDSLSLEDVVNLGILDPSSQDIDPAAPSECQNLGQPDPTQTHLAGAKILDLPIGEASNASIVVEFLMGDQFAAIRKNHQPWHRYLVLGFSAPTGQPAQELQAARQTADQIAALLSASMALDDDQILSIGLHPPGKSIPVGGRAFGVAVYLLSRR